MSNDSILKTFLVAAGVCVVCSLLVSAAAITLKPVQDRNRALDRKRNVLLASGLIEDGRPADIEKLFEQIDARVIDLDSGQFVEDASAEQFDLAAAERDPQQSRELAATEDTAGIRRRPNHQVVYLARQDGEISRYILPVHGKGLWSTMYGLVALDRDLNTVQSFAFFSHGETPGLGGEVDNPRWKALWIGKRAFDAEGHPRLEVVKGHVDAAAADAEHKVDGLSGATLTGNGVTRLLQFWLGEAGYGSFIEKMQKEPSSAGGKKS